LAFALAASPARASAASIDAVVHVASASGTAVADDAYLAAQWAAVASLLGPAGVTVVPRTVPEALPRAIVSRRDRDALAKHVVRGSLNVFVVESLADVDEPGRERMGVHWRSGREHYVILATYRVPGGRACPPGYHCDAPEGLLAHELGHYFGLGHDARPDNLMSYARAGGPLWLDASQRSRVELAARRVW
jgi:hypothetical protein